MGDVILELSGVSYRYPGAPAPAVRNVDLRVMGGELVGVVGPNGSGKTTLLRLLVGTTRPDRGRVRIMGRPVQEWHRRRLACTVGVVAQREEPAFPLQVEQAVFFGRYPHLGTMGSPGREDRDAVTSALERCDVSHLTHRWVATLSGGEWQRVRVARALAQRPKALILDEATANLDVRHEMDVFELVSELVRQEGLAGMIVTHHVNLAARFVDRLVIMDRGAALTSGPPRQVLTRESLERIFGWPVEITEWRGIPQFVPLRKKEQE